MGYPPLPHHRMVCRGRRFAPSLPLWLWLEDLVNCLVMSCGMRLWYVVSPAPHVVMWMVMLKSRRGHIEVSYVFYNAFVM